METGAEGERATDDAKEDELDPLLDTGELVVPAWRTLQERGECHFNTMVVRVAWVPAATVGEKRMMRGRVLEVLGFLEEAGYATARWGNRQGYWKLSEKGLTASEEEVADLWATTFALPRNEAVGVVGAEGERRPTDGAEEDELDPLPDTDELVVPAWRTLHGRGECHIETIASSVAIAVATAEEEGIMRLRLREALEFLEEEGYATVRQGYWKLSDKGLTASEQEVADLWATTFALPPNEAVGVDEQPAVDPSPARQLWSGIVKVLTAILYLILIVFFIAYTYSCVSSGFQEQWIF